MAISNSASPEIILGLGGPEEDHQLHHCCWTGRVSEREEEEEKEEEEEHSSGLNFVSKVYTLIYFYVVSVLCVCIFRLSFLY